MTDPAPTPVTACLVIIGNEILSGRTQDSNLNYLAKGLNEVGVQMREARVIPDVPETIVATVNEVRARYDYVFTTGGIGPTHDDITAECIAAAFGVKLILHPQADRLLAAHYAARGIEYNEARRRMAHVPEGATLIDNPVSTAPGFRIGNVHVMAGVPKIMQAMFDGIRHGLKGGAKVLSRSITCSLAEGTIARDLADIQARYTAVEIGSYPFWTPGGSFGVSLVARSADPASLEHAAEAIIAMIRGFGGEPVERTAEPKE